MVSTCILDASPKGKYRMKRKDFEKCIDVGIERTISGGIENKKRNITVSKTEIKINWMAETKTKFNTKK